MLIIILLELTDSKRMELLMKITQTISYQTMYPKLSKLTEKDLTMYISVTEQLINKNRGSIGELELTSK